MDVSILGARYYPTPPLQLVMSPSFIMWIQCSAVVRSRVPGMILGMTCVVYLQVIAAATGESAVPHMLVTSHVMPCLVELRHAHLTHSCRTQWVV
jgi:hypothetical protein